MKPKAYACFFSAPGGAPFSEQWPRMAAVLAHSLRTRCPGLDYTVEKIEPPRVAEKRSASVITNTQKLNRWAEVVAAAPDGAQLILMDADTFVLRELADVFRDPFDFAYTFRDSIQPAMLPFNAGVVFVRVSAGTRQLFATWRAENEAMALDADRHAPWMRKYGGINQAALGKMLELHAPWPMDVTRVALLPCSEWNCEDFTWNKFDPEVTRIVHLKSALRRDIFSTGPAVPSLRHITRLWRELAREAGRVRQ